MKGYVKVKYTTEMHDNLRDRANILNELLSLSLTKRVTVTDKWLWFTTTSYKIVQIPENVERAKLHKSAGLKVYEIEGCYYSDLSNFGKGIMSLLDLYNVEESVMYIDNDLAKVYNSVKEEL